MWPEDDPVPSPDVGASAILLLPFVLLVGVLAALAPPTPAQAIAADPLIQLLRGPWPVVFLSAALLLAWLKLGRPEPARMRRAAIAAALGAATAAAVAGGLHLAVGPELPAFIPPEESARAGLTNGVAAGVLEEAVFRFGALPVLYALSRKRLGVTSSIALASLATGVLFSLSHELGPAGGVFDPAYMLTRTLFPGVVMSLLFLRVHPSFIVTAHCTAHLVIPALFS